MSTRIISSYNSIGWKEAPYDELTDGSRVARASLQRRLRRQSGEEMRAIHSIRPRRFSEIKIDDLLCRRDGRNTAFEIRPDQHSIPGSGAPVITSVTSPKKKRPLRSSDEAEFWWKPESSHWLTLDYYYGERPTP